MGHPDDGQVAAQLAGSFGVFSGTGDVRVRIRFAPGAARYINENRMHASQQVELQVDGSAIVQFQLSNTTEVKAWVLSFGPAAEVLEPEILRQELADDLGAAVRMYGTTTKHPSTSKARPR